MHYILQVHPTAALKEHTVTGLYLLRQRLRQRLFCVKQSGVFQSRLLGGFYNIGLSLLHIYRWRRNE